MRAALCVLVDDESRLASWVSHHVALGAGTVVVLGGDAAAVDGLGSLVDGVDLRHVAGDPGAAAVAQVDVVLEGIRHDVDWIGFLADDELLVLSEDEDLPAFLSRFPGASAVAVPGTQDGRPSGHVRSFVRPAEVLRVLNARSFDVIGTCVTPDGAPAVWGAEAGLLASSPEAWGLAAVVGLTGAERLAVGQDRHAPTTEDEPLSFDAEFYRAQLPADPWLDDLACVEHYLSQGWRQGLDPSASFSTNGYLAAHPDLVGQDVCPLLHFLARAERSDRRRSRRRRERRQRPSAEELMRSLVDPAFYRAMYPDVAASGLDPVEHFETYGWREHRDPTAWFSVKGYLHANADVATAEVNPFLHWLSRGRLESRPRGSATAAAWEDVLKRDDVTIDTSPRGGVKMMPLQDVLREGTARVGTRGLVVSLGADDYRSNTGGIQTCVRVEAEQLRSEGLDYLYLYPVVSRQQVSTDPATPLQPILNGVTLPPVRTHDLARFVGSLLGGAPLVHAVVHSLLDHAPVELDRQLRLLDCDFDFWAHDFGASCTSYTLLRNDQQFCGGPPLDSGSCRVCVYGASRVVHTEQVAPFLANPRLTVCAPSDSAARWFARSTGCTAPVVVVPHGQIARSGSFGRRPDGPATLAFMGHGHTHKGIEVFRALHRWASSRADLRLLHFGAVDLALGGVDFVKVDHTSELGMAEALASRAVDAALVWPLWPETFSLVTFEAMAAGCAIVTHEGSGNVVDAARAAGRAILRPDRRRLERAVIDGSLARDIVASRAERPALGEFVWTGLSTARLGLGVRS